MTSDEFNKKYEKYLEDRHYGLAIDNPAVVEYLDKEFEKEISENPEFSYSQIKTKFMSVCVYAKTGKSHEWQYAIEDILHLNRPAIPLKLENNE